LFFQNLNLFKVSSNAPILFRQASSIGTLEDVLENMQTRIGSLKSTVDRFLNNFLFKN
jgi:hypothetical protein